MTAQATAANQSGLLYIVWYKDADKEKMVWSSKLVSSLDEVPAIKQTAYHIAPLAIQQLKEDMTTEDKELAPRLGDFVIDLDHNDVSVAISDFNKLLDVLVRLGVDLDYCPMYASGGKGFHITIPGHFYGNHRKAVVGLNRIYSYMAIKLGGMAGISTIDKNLYKGGNGQLLRVENKVRQSGTYKVPITPTEARIMDEAMYKQLVLAPRTVAVSEDASLSSLEMTGLFNTGREVFKESARGGAKLAGTPVQYLAEYKQIGDHPTCIEWLICQNNLKDGPDKSFNKMTLNLATYLNTVVLTDPADFDKYFERYADCTGGQARSPKYDTKAKRISHIKDVLAWVHSQGDRYPFTCHHVAQRFTASPCNGCPVRQKEEAAKREKLQLFETPDGVFRRGAKDVVHEVTDFVPQLMMLLKKSNEVLRTEGARFRLLKGGSEVGDVAISMEVFASRQKLNEALSYYACTFKGTDRDLPAFRDYVINQSRSSATVSYATYTLGVQEFGESDTPWTWVEPKWAVDGTGMASSLVYVDRQNIANQISIVNEWLGDASLPEVTKAIQNLFRTNKVECVTPLIGWAAACNLKPHMMKYKREFPLLHVFGPSGIGKTQSVSLATLLAGANAREDGAMDVTKATKWALDSSVVSTTSVPRIFDECNKHRMESQAKWSHVLGALKAAYGQGAMPRGTLTTKSAMDLTGAKVVNLMANSPIAYLATEEMEDTELKTRSVAVCYKPYSTTQGTYSDHHEAVWEYGWKHLKQLTADMVRIALTMSVEKVATWYEEEATTLPKDFLKGRSKSNYAVILLGLRLMRTTFEERGYNPILITELDELKKQYLEYLNQNSAAIKESKQITEVTRIMQELSYMASTCDKHGNPELRLGIHYLADNNHVYIKAVSVFLLYQEYMKRLQQKPELSRPNQFEKLMLNEPYYLFKGPIIGTNLPGEWSTLDRKMLEKAGVCTMPFTVSAASV